MLFFQDELSRGNVGGRGVGVEGRRMGIENIYMHICSLYLHICSMYLHICSIYVFSSLFPLTNYHLRKNWHKYNRTTNIMS